MAPKNKSTPPDILKQLAHALKLGRPGRSSDSDDEDTTCPHCGGSGVHSADKYEDGEIIGKATWECNECGGGGHIRNSNL